MLRVADQYAGTDTGRQRRANEDSLLARSPLFVVADGMGGAQAGEVASKVAVAHFTEDFAGEDGHDAADRLLRAAHDANAEIHALSEADTRRAGMGTTLTAAYVGGDEVFVAHVGDSRAYRWRHGELTRITEDHSLVEELRRQGRLTEEEAEEHPQRSIITRALDDQAGVMGGVERARLRGVKARRGVHLRGHPPRAQIAQRTARDPQQEQVQHGEEAELERDRRGCEGADDRGPRVAHVSRPRTRARPRRCR